MMDGQIYFSLYVFDLTDIIVFSTASNKSKTRLHVPLEQYTAHIRKSTNTVSIWPYIVSIVHIVFAN